MDDIINNQITDVIKNTEVIPQPLQTSYVPITFADLVQWSNIVKDSILIPPSYRGKAADIVVAAQYGSEVGLKPLQALQSIAVINGRPSLYGDGLLAVCQNSPNFEWIKENQTEEEAICTVKRRGYPEHTVVFTKQDAIVAGLWSKPGPWKNSPKRMLQMRARGFACRDQFSDALKGFCSAEEQDDIITINQEPVREKIAKNPIELATQEQIAELKQLLKDLEKNDEYVNSCLSKMNISSIEEVPTELMTKWIAALDKQFWEKSQNNEIKND